ncbi:hypothetical protein A0H81_13408, partial [Grifola frondosa]
MWTPSGDWAVYSSLSSRFGGNEVTGQYPIIVRACPLSSQASASPTSLGSCTSLGEMAFISPPTMPTSMDFRNCAISASCTGRARSPWPGRLSICEKRNAAVDLQKEHRDP